MAIVTPTGTKYQALIRHDPLINADNLVSKTDATAPSTYGQEDPIPGIPAPQQDTHMVLEASGTQSEDGQLEFYTQNGGHPGPDGAGFLWRDVAAGDLASQYKGQDGYQVFTAFDYIQYATSGRIDCHPHVIRLQDGDVLISGNTTNATPAIHRHERSDNSISNYTVNSVDNITITANHLQCLCQLPSGRVLFFIVTEDLKNVDVHYSDDDGATWSNYSSRVLKTELPDTAANNMQAAYSNGQVILIIGYNGDKAAIYGSDDLANSFTQTDDDFGGTRGAAAVKFLNVVAQPGGGFTVAYYPTIGLQGAIEVYNLPSAFQEASAIDPVVIINTAAVTYDGLALAIDEDGKLFTFIGDTTNARLYVYESTDGGENWTAYTHYLLDDYDWRDFAASASGGRVLMAGRWDTGSTAGDSLGLLKLGGHSSHTVPTTDDDNSFADSQYIGYADGSGSQKGAHWFATDDPPTATWTTSTSFGINSSGYLPVSTSAATVYNNSAGAQFTSAGNVEFDLEIPAGNGDTATNEIYVQLRVATGSADYLIGLRLADTGFQIYDYAGAATIDSVESVDLTSRTKIRLAVDEVGYVRTWYCNPGIAREWTAGPGGQGSSGGASANNAQVWWGHGTVTATDSRWYSFGWTANAGKWSPKYVGSTAVKSWENPQDIRPRKYSNYAALVADGVKIRAVAGPSRFGEKWDVTADYKYPKEAIYPQVYASPKRAWRGETSTAGDRSFTWNIGEGDTAYLMEANAIGCFLFNTNIRECQLQYGNAAGVFTTVLDMKAYDGFDSLDYLLEGGRCRPQFTGTRGEKYIHYNMLAGDTLELDYASTPKRRKILRNTEGAWPGAAELTKHPTISFEPDNTELTTGTMRIWRRSFGGVYTNWDYSTKPQYLRLLIPRTNPLPDGHFQIGSLVIGPAYIFARQFDRGHTTQFRHNVEVTERRDGSRVSRKLGDKRREITISWMNTAHDLSDVQESSPLPDYYPGNSAGGLVLPVAGHNDTSRALEGFVDSLEGPNQPCVFLKRLPADANTAHYFNQYHDFVYGRVESNPQLDHVTGDEMVDELERVESITILEEV